MTDVGLMSKPDQVDRGEAALAQKPEGKLILLLLAEQRRTNDLLTQLVTALGQRI